MADDTDVNTEAPNNNDNQLHPGGMIKRLSTDRQQRFARWDQVRPGTMPGLATLRVQRRHEQILPVNRSFQSCLVDAGLAREISLHWMRQTSATRIMEKKGRPLDRRQLP
jgi:hypothetical protein